ncbi:unannotated protein [freshwater metagenome]|uniref:phosphoribosylformylglycinamidine cyclo-ligase n=1 Tax=freshwater metagenome TaxID=449393 RepID=A0A6J7NMV1_9ZZZZ
MLPESLDSVVQLGSWPIPPLFRLVQEVASLPIHELYRTLNMGIGMVAVVAVADLTAVQALIPEETWVIGRLTPAPATAPGRQVHLLPA